MKKRKTRASLFSLFAILLYISAFTLFFSYPDYIDFGIVCLGLASMFLCFASAEIVKIKKEDAEQKPSESEPPSEQN